MAPTNVLTQSLYQGTVYSASLSWPAGATTATATGLLSDQDAGNNSNQLTFALETSFDGGKSFVSDGQAAWAGGSTVKPPGVGFALPSIQVSYSGSNSPPTHVRCRMDIPSVLSVGASILFA